jgi:hypothetical protein
MLHLLFVYKTTRWSINNFKHGNDNALNKLFKDAERNETDSQQGMTMNFERISARKMQFSDCDNDGKLFRFDADICLIGKLLGKLFAKTDRTQPKQRANV